MYRAATLTYRTHAKKTDDWSRLNAMQLSVDRGRWCYYCHEGSSSMGVPVLIMANKEVDRVKSGEILGVPISNGWTWKQHVDYVHNSKANPRLKFLCMLKRAGTCRRDMLPLYKTAVRCAMKYACPVWHTSLTTKQNDQPESCQTRALRAIWRQIYPLIATGLDTLQAQKKRISQDFSLKVLFFPQHKPPSLPPPPPSQSELLWSEDGQVPRTDIGAEHREPNIIIDCSTNFSLHSERTHRHRHRQRPLDKGFIQHTPN